MTQTRDERSVFAAKTAKGLSWANLCEAWGWARCGWPRPRTARTP